MFTCPVMNIKISPSGSRICISTKPISSQSLEIKKNTAKGNNTSETVLMTWPSPPLNGF